MLEIDGVSACSIVHAQELCSAPSWRAVVAAFQPPAQCFGAGGSGKNLSQEFFLTLCRPKRGFFDQLDICRYHHEWSMHTIAHTHTHIYIYTNMHVYLHIYIVIYPYRTYTYVHPRHVCIYYLYQILCMSTFLLTCFVSYFLLNVWKTDPMWCPINWGGYL